MYAIGFTVTVTVNTLPLVHTPDAGVTLYVAVTAVAVVLVRLSFNTVLPVPELPPVSPVPSVGDDQAYVVPPGIVPVGV